MYVRASNMARVTVRPDRVLHAHPGVLARDFNSPEIPDQVGSDADERRMNPNELLVRRATRLRACSRQFQLDLPRLSPQIRLRKR